MTTNRKQKYYQDRFDEKYKVIKTNLEFDHPLTTTQKQWLRLQRLSHQKEGGIDPITPYKIEKLDELIPLLGYDWRSFKKSNGKKLPSFKKRIEEIKLTIFNNGAPDSNQFEWLKSKKRIFKRSPKSLSIQQQRQLDDLTELLGFSWRDIIIKKGNSIFNYYYYNIKNAILKGEDISDSDKDWLISQGGRYAAQEYISIPEHQLERLEELKELLKFPWEVSNTNQNPYINKEHQSTAQWFKEMAPFLNITQIERKYDMPKGLIQKFCKYDTPIDHRWVLVLEEFRKEFCEL